MNKHPLRRIYLYLFTFIGLVLVTIGMVRLVSLGLKAYVFTKADLFYYQCTEVYYPPGKQIPIETPADSEARPAPAPDPEAQAKCEEQQREQRTAERQREAAESIAMMLVGIPLYLYHWRVIQREKESESSS